MRATVWLELDHAYFRLVQQQVELYRKAEPDMPEEEGPLTQIAYAAASGRQWVVALIAVALTVAACVGSGCRAKGHQVPKPARGGGRSETRVLRTGEAPHGTGPIKYPFELGFWSSGFSVISAFNALNWGTDIPARSFLMGGRKESVDMKLGRWGFLQGLAALTAELGPGVEVEHAFGTDHLYKDEKGTRLIACDAMGFWFNMLILTADNAYEAKLVDRDLSTLRTESGIGLGQSERRLLKALGKPSARYRLPEYVILWYLGKPRHIVTGGEAYDEGHAAAYALKKDKVVEIWLHEWDNQRHG